MTSFGPLQERYMRQGATWELWLAAGNGGHTLKYIVTSLSLFSEKKCPKTLLPHLSISWLKIWPGFNQDLYNSAIVLFINDPVYWHLTIPVGLTLGVKSGGKIFDPHIKEVNIMVPAHLPVCKNACLLNTAHQHLISQINIKIDKCLF